MRCFYFFLFTFTLLGLTSRVEAEPPLQEIKHERPVWVVTWSADGKVLVSAGDDGIVRFTHLDDKKEKRIDTKQAIRAVALSPDGKLLAVKPQNGNLTLWSIDNGTLLKSSTLPNYGGELG